MLVFLFWLFICLICNNLAVFWILFGINLIKIQLYRFEISFNTLAFLFLTSFCFSFRYQNYELFAKIGRTVAPFENFVECLCVFFLSFDILIMSTKWNVWWMNMTETLLADQTARTNRIENNLSQHLINFSKRYDFLFIKCHTYVALLHLTMN